MPASWTSTTWEKKNKVRHHSVTLSSEDSEELAIDPRSTTAVEVDYTSGTIGFQVAMDKDGSNFISLTSEDGTAKEATGDMTFKINSGITALKITGGAATIDITEVQ